MTLPSDVIAAAKAAGRTLATAESCTGGMVAAALTDVAGSSSAFLGGVVSYANSVKTGVIAVPDAAIADHGAVSEQVARAMAQGVRDVIGADIAVSTTGIAGPGGSEHKPEGRVCFAIATADGCHSETVEFGALGRENVRQAATRHALRLVMGALSRA